MSLRKAAQDVLDSLDKPDSAVERLRLAKLVTILRRELDKNKTKEEVKWSVFAKLG